MERNRLVISVGSNIHPEKHIEQARAQIHQDHHLVKASTILETAPIGEEGQPNFWNCVFLAETSLDRQEFEAYLKEVEALLGRNREEETPFGPRKIDLDLVVWNGKVVHPDFWSRSFVREGVQEVWPGLEKAGPSPGETF